MVRAFRRLALVAALLATGCHRRTEFVVGVAVGFDGVVGARIAADSVNRTGGIDGVPLRLDVASSRAATSAEESISIADAFAANPAVLAVVGHSNSAASLAASQIYNARGLAHIAPTTTTPLFSSAGPYSFRLVPDDRQQAAFLARQLPPGARRVAIVYVNDDYGRALDASVRARVVRTGASIVYETPYLESAEGAARFVSAAAALASTSPDVLCWLGRGPDLDRLLALLRPRLPSLPVLASDGVDAAVVYQHPERFVGVRFVRFVDPDAPGPTSAMLRARYRAIAHRELTSETALSFDATMLIAAALRGGARDRKAVRDWLASIGKSRPPFQGATGAIAFDSVGDVRRSHLLAEARADGVHAVPAR